MTDILKLPVGIELGRHNIVENMRNNLIKLQCTSMRDAAKLFGGDRKLEGFFAIDVKSRKDKWRIILQPLDENECPFVPCHIDVIAASVRVIEIREVSAHYE